MNMILETERLYLREMTKEDFPLLCKHLQDDADLVFPIHAEQDVCIVTGDRQGT